MKYITPTAHREQRRTVDPAHRQIHVQPVSEPLYVITAMFNPQRFQSRYRHYWGFRKHVADAGAVLITVELALRDRHHEVTDPDNPLDIQLRGRSELWYKENLSNIGTRHLPPDAGYVAFVDADFHFTRPDWATETVQMLQHHKAVQMYSHLTYETYDHQPHKQMPSFAFQHINGQPTPKTYGRIGAVGGAWAFRRSALSDIGGLLEHCILGSGDWHMAFALAGRPDNHPDMKFSQLPEYVNVINRWRKRAEVIQGDIGYVNAHAVHHWHGDTKNRGYATRPQILIDNGYNPYVDVFHDENGVLQLAGNKPKFRDAIRAYFRSRNEDSIDLVV